MQEPIPYSTEMFHAIRKEREELQQLKDELSYMIVWHPVIEFEDIPFDKQILLRQSNSRASYVFAILASSYYLYDGGEYSTYNNLMDFIKEIDLSFETESEYVNKSTITHWALIPSPKINEENNNG